ncbi:MAG TPA: hypothetical protein VFB93_23000 [Burkholderiales bacterium]|nr:hypothetical protein [Burkholderiales bacterium]
MLELAFASLAWRSAPMPGAGPVEMALLPRLPDSGFRAFVRFPAGWSRPDRGHYAVPEEFLVLEGELSLNGRNWKAGDLAWVRAWQLRRDLQSAPGCLVFAWFGGTPRWLPGAPAARPGDGPAHRTSIEGRELVRLLPGAVRETLNLDDYTWRATPA